MRDRARPVTVSAIRLQVESLLGAPRGSGNPRASAGPEASVGQLEGYGVRDSARMAEVEPG
jgi:hypothetical protein